MDHLKRTSTRTRLPMLSRPVFLRLEEDAELVCCSSRKVGRLQRLSFKRSKNGQIACGEKTATESREGPFAGLNLQRGQTCMTASACLPKLPTQPGKFTSCRFAIIQTAKRIYIGTRGVATACCYSLGQSGGSWRIYVFAEKLSEKTAQASRL